MLHEFLTTHREEFIEQNGISLFPEQLIGLRDGFFRKGFTVDQVVHDYGDLCQYVTELAAERKAPISVDEFRTHTSSEAGPVRRI